MPHLSERDRQYVARFVAVVGEALEECPGAETSARVLFGACAEHSGRPFIPLGTFERLLKATGYKRVDRRYGKRFKDLRPKNPDYHHRVWYWN
jgi:hypothetical protein